MGDDILPFILFEDGKYKLHPPAIDFLSQLEHPFATMSCAGKFRTGKSFMINRLLRNPPSKGFGVGETVQACTRGIWLCRTPLQGGGVNVFVMDTEGIDALDAESDHDVRIFAIAVLLSTVVVYNSMSHLDEAAIQTLSLMTRVAESLGTGHTPTLYWVLRDFMLQLVGPDGKPMSHADYLEDALKNPIGSKCKTREAINTIFPTRHLVTLPRPQRGETALKLDAKGANALAPRFEKCLDTFRNHIVANAPPLMANEVHMSGKCYVAHAQFIVDKINQENSIPRIQDSWTLLQELQQKEKEQRDLRALMVLMETECPYGSEAQVHEWVSSVTGEHSSSVQQQLWEVAKVKHVKAAEELAKEWVEDSVKAFEASSFQLLPTLPMDHPHRYLFQSKMFDRLSLVLPKIQDYFQSLPNLETQSLRSELNAVKDSYRLALEREQEPPPPPPPREDAATDPMEEDEKEVVEYDEDKEGLVDDHILEELEATLASMECRAKAAEERCKTVEEENKVFESNIESLHALSVDKIAEHKKAKETALEQHAIIMEQKKVLEEQCEKQRTLLREAQEKTMEIHRTSLEEMRRRDVEQRTMAETQRKEWGEVNGRMETRDMENKTLKRRIDELLCHSEECKRLKTENSRLQVSLTRAETERDNMRLNGERKGEEVSSLRSANVSLERRVAVLEATSKLDVFKRSMAEASSRDLSM